MSVYFSAFFFSFPLLRLHICFDTEDFMDFSLDDERTFHWLSSYLMIVYWISPLTACLCSLFASGKSSVFFFPSSGSRMTILLFFFIHQIDHDEIIRTFLSRLVCYLPVYFVWEPFQLSIEYRIANCVRRGLTQLSHQMNRRFSSLAWPDPLYIIYYSCWMEPSIDH